MKKIIAITMLIAAPFALPAQHYRLSDGRYFSQELINIPATILIVYLLTTFLLTIIRSNLDYRLKSRMVDKGVSDKIVEQFLQPHNRDSRGQAMKWFLILAGIGVGLTIVSFTLPLGIHSVAILVFSVAFSFLGYYYFLKRSGSQRLGD
jgi:hypothetical protein